MDTENFATRLKVFFEDCGISHAQFADACGISRPTLSQILTGRNKKVSNILVSQIHAAFPNLSVLWLMFGEGDMYENGGESGGKADAGEDEPGNASVFAPDPVAPELKISVDDSPRGMYGGYASKKKAADDDPKRKISHITVYYDDQTFQTFYPK